jgi:hypothetical protein
MSEINSTINVTKTIKNDRTGVVSEDVASEDIIAIHRFETNPAHVEVGMALTMNLGNFESAKLSVSVMVPCYKEEIEEAYKFVERFVTDRVAAERDVVVASRNGKANPI